MQIISQEVFNTLNLKRSFRGAETLTFYSLTDGLAVNQNLLVNKEEWPLKNFPSNGEIARRVSPGKKFSVRQLANDAGFVVTRTT